MFIENSSAFQATSGSLKRFAPRPLVRPRSFFSIAPPTLSHGAFSWETGSAACQLDDEGLHGRATPFHSNSIVKVKLEGIRDRRHIDESHCIHFDRIQRRVRNRFRKTTPDFKGAHLMKKSW